jgi:hypothetical protein
MSPTFPIESDDFCVEIDSDGEGIAALAEKRPARF